MDEQQPRRRSGAFRAAATFAAGAAVGTGIALLTAPASGKVTRERIGKRVHKISKTATRKLGRTQKLLARKADRTQKLIARKATRVGKQATAKLQHAREWVVNQVNTNGHKVSLRRRALRPSHA
jgi:gas vesicle protein